MNNLDFTNLKIGTIVDATGLGKFKVIRLIPGGYYRTVLQAENNKGAKKF